MPPTPLNHLYRGSDMKKMILSLLLGYVASIANERSTLWQLQNHLDQLQKELKEIKAEQNDSYETLQRVETKTILDTINFSPELELRFDSLHYKNRGIANEETSIPNNPLYTGNAPAPGNLQRRDEYTKNFDIASTIYFDLRMNAKLDSATIFHGKLSFAETSQSYQRLCILSRDIKAQPSSSAFDVTLAYIDYTPHKNDPYAYTLSMGILPTTNGTPMHFSQNEPRQSMFPALVFDMNSYGLIFTQKMHNLYARTVFAKAYTLRSVFYPYQCNRENIDNATIAGIYADDTFVYDHSEFLLSAGFNALLDFKAHPYLGPDVTSAQTKVLGDIYTTGIGLDVHHLHGWNMDLFLHAALSIPKPNGNVQDYKIVRYENGIGLTSDNTPGFSEADYASGTMLQKNGHAFFCGTKYTLNKSFDFGMEYNHGSKYWFSATQGAKNLYNKLSLRGDAYEAYMHLMFNTHLYAKGGFLQMNEKFTGSGWHFGIPAKKDATQRIFYISLHAKY